MGSELPWIRIILIIITIGLIPRVVCKYLLLIITIITNWQKRHHTSKQTNFTQL